MGRSGCITLCSFADGIWQVCTIECMHIARLPGHQQTKLWWVLPIGLFQLADTSVVPDADDGKDGNKE